MSIDLTETQKAELAQGNPVPLDNGRYFIISRDIYQRVREALEVHESDWSLYEAEDLPEEP